MVEYAGTYELTPTFQLVVSVEGEQLMLQGTGQPKVQMFAESDAKFFLKVVDAVVEFVRNDKGEGRTREGGTARTVQGRRGLL